MQKQHRIRRMVPMSVLALACCLFAACAPSGGGSTTAGSTTSPNATATTPAKAKPTGPVKVDQSLCDRIMSKSEAGQITATSVNNVRVIATDAGGSCNYETAPFKSAVTVTFIPGGAGSLQAIQSQLTSQPGFKGSITPISGLGDDAIAVVNPIPNTSIIQYRVIVIYGAVMINCVLPNSAAGDTVAIGQLKQVAQLVVDRL